MATWLTKSQHEKKKSIISISTQGQKENFSYYKAHKLKDKGLPHRGVIPMKTSILSPHSSYNASEDIYLIIKYSFNIH